MNVQFFDWKLTLKILRDLLSRLNKERSADCELPKF